MPVGLLATEVSPPVSVPPGAGLSTVCARVSYRSGEFLMLGVVGMGGESERSRGVRVRQGRPGAGPGRLHRRLRWLAQAAVGRCPCRSQQQRQCSCSDTARRVGRLADPGKSGSGVRPRRAVLRPGLVRSLACPQVGLTPEHFLFGPQRQRQAAVGARRGSGSTSCPWRRQRYIFTGRWL